MNPDPRLFGTVPRRLARGRALLLGLLLATLGTGLLVPLYTDEVAWRLQLSRFVQDGGVDRSVVETCGPNTIAVPPLFMWPVRLLGSGMTWLVDDPLGVRLVGIAGAMLAVLLVRLLVRRLVPPSPRQAWLETLAYALLGLGLLPFLMVWSRPEQPILLALLGALLLGVSPVPRGALARHAPVVGVVALALVALSYHPKAVFYLPVFALAALLAVTRPGRRGMAAASLGAIALAGLLAFRYWSHRFACPGDPVLAAKLARENVSVLLLGHGWGALVHLVPQLFADMSPRLYVHVATPALPLMSDWLPAPALSAKILKLWVKACKAAWIVAALVAVLATIRSARDPRRSWPRLLAGLAIVGCATAWAAFQLNKNAYESALYLPAMIVAGLLICSSSHVEDALLPPLVLAVASVSILSQLLLLVSYAPRLPVLMHGGTIADQHYSISPFRYDRAAIAAAGARCHLAPGAGVRRVLVDDLTYFAYAHTPMPLYWTGVLGPWNGLIADSHAWLHTHGSPGVVMACTGLPLALRRRAIATGPLCCIDTR